MKKHVGFTLIELIVVIIILGILAAYAIPKYVQIEKDARIATVKGMYGSLHAAADLVHATAVARNATGTVNIGAATIEIAASKYPSTTATGMAAAIADTDGFTVTDAKFTRNGASDPNACYAEYTVGTLATDVPAYTLDTGGC